LLAHRLRDLPWKIEPIHYTPASPQFARTRSERDVFCHRLWPRWHIEELLNS
jgi:hypothetical protein